MVNTTKKIICAFTAIIISVITLCVSASAEITVTENTCIKSTLFSNMAYYKGYQVGTFVKTDTVYEVFNLCIFDKTANTMYCLYSGVNGHTVLGKVVESMCYGYNSSTNNLIPTVNVGNVSQYSLTISKKNIDTTGLTVNVNQSYTLASNSQVVNLDTDYKLTNFIDVNGTNINIENIYTHNLELLYFKFNQSNNNSIALNFKNGMYRTTDFTNFISTEYQTTKSTDMSGKILTAPQTDENKADGYILKYSKSWLENESNVGKICFMITDNTKTGLKRSFYIRVSENQEIYTNVENLMINHDTYLANQEDWLNHLGVWDEIFYNGYYQVLTDKEKAYLKEYCNNMSTLGFNLIGTISKDTYTFDYDVKPFKSTKVITLDMCDYFSVVKDDVYKIELVDSSNNSVLDTTYIYSNSTKSKNSVLYGNQEYTYEDKDTALTDVTNNTPTNYYTYKNTSASNYSANYTPFTGQIGYNGNNAIEDNFDNIMTDINGYVSQTQKFFTACWGLLPPEIWTIIIAGLTILIGVGIVKLAFFS